MRGSMAEGQTRAGSAHQTRFHGRRADVGGQCPPDQGCCCFHFRQGASRAWGAAPTSGHSCTWVHPVGDPEHMLAPGSCKVLLCPRQGQRSKAATGCTEHTGRPRPALLAVGMRRPAALLCPPKKLPCACPPTRHCVELARDLGLLGTECPHHGQGTGGHADAEGGTAPCQGPALWPGPWGLC